jgi:hypothetical protein
MLVLDGYGGVNQAACCYLASKLHKVGVAHNPIGYIDVEIVSGIASPPLRHKVQAPGSVVGRSPCCGSNGGCR